MPRKENAGEAIRRRNEGEDRHDAEEVKEGYELLVQGLSSRKLAEQDVGQEGEYTRLRFSCVGRLEEPGAAGAGEHLGDV